MRGPRRSDWAKWLLGLVGWAVVASDAVAQTRQDSGTWLAAFGNGKFDRLEEGSPLRWWFDTHYRMTDDANGFNQSVIRPGLGYALNQDHVLWSGYAWVRTEPVGLGEVFDEHRFWQQWTFAPSFNRWSFIHRSRLEERWLEAGDDVGLRWRQFARAQYNLTDTPQWSLIAWDEVFFHLNDTDWGTRAGFDQNRAFLGVGFKRSPEDRVRFEIGYLNQFLYRRGGTDLMNHLVSLYVFF